MSYDQPRSFWYAEISRKMYSIKIALRQGQGTGNYIEFEKILEDYMKKHNITYLPKPRK